MTQLDNIHPLIADYVAHHAKQTPTQEAVVFGDQRLTYAELETQICHCAKALLAQGVEKGDRVAVLCTSRPEYWITFLATTRIGAIWLGLNPKYRLQEIGYVLEDAKPRLLLAMAAFEGQTYTDIINTIQKDYSFIEQVVSLTTLLPCTQSFDDFLKTGVVVSDDVLAQRQASIDPMDPALLVYTSGSTGKPKGALLSHYGLCFGATVQNTHYKVDKPNLICNFPINHVACVADTCCVVLVAGGTIHFQERFDPEKVLRCIDQERVNILAGVPTMLLMVLDHPQFNTTDLSSVELLIWGGAALPEPSIERLRTLNSRMISVYGMTETAANTVFSRDNASLEQLRDSIGYPSPHMPCRIVNTEGNSCDVGEQGELQFKGEHLLLEYLNRLEATKAVYTDDGWLHTGDLGYWRDDGAITLVGRLTEMFKSGGYNVYPREIELHIETHPAVDMAAVVGVPDPLYQEVGAAFIQLKAGQAVTVDALKNWCKTKLANYKVPKHFEIQTALPVLPVGKVDKVTLKKSIAT